MGLECGTAVLVLVDLVVVVVVVVMMMLEVEVMVMVISLVYWMMVVMEITDEERGDDYHLINHHPYYKIGRDVIYDKQEKNAERKN